MSPEGVTEDLITGFTEDLSVTDTETKTLSSVTELTGDKDTVNLRRNCIRKSRSTTDPHRM